MYLSGSIGMASSFACNTCIMSNCTLTADCDLRGLGTALKIVDGSTINIGSRRLYVPAQVLTGTCTFKGTNMDDHTLDLTANDSSRVTATPTGTVTPASNAFNNNYARGDNAKRILRRGEPAVLRDVRLR